MAGSVRDVWSMLVLTGCTSEDPVRWRQRTKQFTAGDQRPYELGGVLAGAQQQKVSHHRKHQTCRNVTRRHIFKNSADSRGKGERRTCVSTVSGSWGMMLSMSRTSHMSLAPEHVRL